jgi:hypothetical protein
MTPRTFFAKLPAPIVERLMLLTPDQIRAALDTADNLMVDYAVGALRGGHVDWGDLNDTFNILHTAFPKRYREILDARASEFFSEEDWREEVANGDTKLGYDAWLTHQIETIVGEAELGTPAFALEYPEKEDPDTCSIQAFPPISNSLNIPVPPTR